MKYKNIALLPGNQEKAIMLSKEILRRYSNIKAYNPKTKKENDLVIVLGGDGFMLKAIHENMDCNAKFYGINCGTMGFLLNEFDSSEDLMDVIELSEEFDINHLDCSIIDTKEKQYNAIAINEISLIRLTHQMTKIKIEVDGIERMPALLGDGVLVSTKMGSGAYNFSVSGPILPSCSNLLSLMPISPFRPRRWAGAMLADDSVVKLTVLDEDNRRVSLMCDYVEFLNIKSVETKLNKESTKKILFHKDLLLKEKILREQFSGY